MCEDLIGHSPQTTPLHVWQENILFDVEAWLKSNSAVTPYAIQEFPMTVFNGSKLQYMYSAFEHYI